MAKITIIIEDKTVEELKKMITITEEPPKTDRNGYCACPEELRKWISLGHRSECGRCGGELL